MEDAAYLPYYTNNSKGPDVKTSPSNKGLHRRKPRLANSDNGARSASGLFPITQPPSLEISDIFSEHKLNRASLSRPNCTGTLLRKNVLKTKRGLSGFVNGFRVSALADTGASPNVISEEYQKKQRIHVGGPPCTFTLGSSGTVQSIGTVNLSWAFSENPKETLSIICHVVPNCIYDLIFGREFLLATQTMSKYRHRLTQCLFAMRDVLHLDLFGGCSQFLNGKIADKSHVLAVPDSGAEANVMNYCYAKEQNFRVRTGRRHRKICVFADGTEKETVGQVDTFWTFDSGHRIPITFEILEDCCYDVVIGDEILCDHDVYGKHASSLITFETDAYGLAPFGFRDRIQKTAEMCEQLRRETYDFKTCYGACASPAEREAEGYQRMTYDHRVVQQSLSRKNIAAGSPGILPMQSPSAQTMNPSSDDRHDLLSTSITPASQSQRPVYSSSSQEGQTSVAPRLWDHNLFSDHRNDFLAVISTPTPGRDPLSTLSNERGTSHIGPSTPNSRPRWSRFTKWISLSRRWRK